MNINIEELSRLVESMCARRGHSVCLTIDIWAHAPPRGLAAEPATVTYKAWSAEAPKSAGIGYIAGESPELALLALEAKIDALSTRSDDAEYEQRERDRARAL